MRTLSRSLFTHLILQSEVTVLTFQSCILPWSLAVILNLLDSPTPLLYNADSGIRVKSGTVNDPIKPQASRTINSSCGEQRRFTAHGGSQSPWDLYGISIALRSLSRSLSTRLILSGHLITRYSLA